jgi:hypothetical protein
MREQQEDGIRTLSPFGVNRFRRGGQSMRSCDAQAVARYRKLERVRLAIFRTMNLCHGMIVREGRWNAQAHEKLVRVESFASVEATLFLVD